MYKKERFEAYLPMEEMIKKYDAEGLKRMVMLLAKILRDIGDTFNIVAKDEDDE